MRADRETDTRRAAIGKKVVLYFSPVFDDDSFGAAKATREKIAAIGALGLEAFPLTLGKRPRGRLRAGLRRLGYDVVSLASLLAKGPDLARPAAVICRANSGVLPIVAARLCKTPFIVEVHSDPRDEAGAMRMSRLHMLFGAWSGCVQRAALASADVAVFVHPALARALEHQVKSGAILVQGNGTDLNFFKPGDRAAARRALDVPPDTALVASFVGQVLEARGVEQLLHTFDHVLRLEPKSQLLIAGPVSVDYRRSLESRFSLVNVRFFGGVPKETARTVIQAASICALPVNERRVSPGSPLKLYDYAACGRPIAAQEAVEGYGDQVSALGIGTSVDFFNAKAAATAIVRMSRDFLAREDFEQERIRVVAELHFGWDTVLASWFRRAGIGVDGTSDE